MLEFPQPGEYLLQASLMSAGCGSEGDAAGRLRDAKAVSQQITVKATGAEQAELAKAPDDSDGLPRLSIISVGNEGVDPSRQATVPVSGDVVIATSGLSEQPFVFLSAHIPYTDRTMIYGPASRGSKAGEHVLHGVSFDVPGDPEQVHLELVAFASPTQEQPARTSWRVFRRKGVPTSRTYGVIVDRKRPLVDSTRVPRIAITRIGIESVNSTASRSGRTRIKDGALTEVGLYNGVPEGSKVYLITRCDESSSWRLQGPAIRKGAAPDPAGGPNLSATWVWHDTRFQTAGPARRGAQECEVAAVLSAGFLPNARIGTAFLASRKIETVSETVDVRVTVSQPDPALEPSITRIGRREVDLEGETVVYQDGRVEVELGEPLPPDLSVYVAKHKVGSSVWQLFEGIPGDASAFVPDVSFELDAAGEPSRFQLLAIVTRGPLPHHQYEYEDLLPSVLVSSKAVDVVRSSGVLGDLSSRFSAWGNRQLKTLSAPSGPVASSPHDPAVSDGGMGPVWWLLLTILFAILSLLVLIGVLEWLSGVFSRLSSLCHDYLAGAAVTVEDWFEPVPGFGSANSSWASSFWLWFSMESRSTTCASIPTPLLTLPAFQPRKAPV